MAVSGKHIEAGVEITKIVLKLRGINANPNIRVSMLQPVAWEAAAMVCDNKSAVVEQTVIADEVMHRILTEKPAN